MTEHLPLSQAEHRKQHSMNEVVTLKPHLLALSLYGLWNELGDDAEPYCEAVIMEGLRK